MYVTERGAWCASNGISGTLQGRRHGDRKSRTMKSIKTETYVDPLYGKDRVHQFAVGARVRRRCLFLFRV